MKHLVILAPNWLGDAVMALPAIADVRRAAPAARITVAARAPVAPLYSLVPGVDDTIVLSKPASIGDVGRWTAVGAELADRPFDAALVLPNSIHAALEQDGIIYIATDHLDYFRKIEDITRSAFGFARVEPAIDLPPSRFGLIFSQKGATIHWLALRKISPVT